MTTATRDALIAVSVISTIPNLLLYLIPGDIAKQFYGINIQHLLLSFASGGLLGDVFIHALPHLLLADTDIFGIKDSHVRSIIIGNATCKDYLFHCMLWKLSQLHKLYS
jgi:solute carrier family 39 (zinc transporter), member 7